MLEALSKSITLNNQISKEANEKTNTQPNPTSTKQQSTVLQNLKNRPKARRVQRKSSGQRINY